MSRPHLALALFVLLITVPPACGQPAARPMPPVPAEVAWRTGPLVVFSAGGAGGDNTVAEALSMMRDRSGVPLTVQSVAWCRMGGPGQNVSDHSAQLAAAAKVADSVRRLRARWPDANVVLVGYSAGTRVVLAAAEALPAGSVDRIILLGAGVSCGYDLRPALHASRGGIDSFFCETDPVLSHAESWWGTCDGPKTATAGRVGFQYPCAKSECAAYSGLRQYHWTPAMGGYGGHFTWVCPTFLGQLFAAIQSPPPPAR